RGVKKGGPLAALSFWETYRRSPSSAPAACAKVAPSQMIRHVTSMLISPLLVRCLAAGLLIACAASASVFAEESKQVPRDAAEIQLSFAPVVRKAAPAVVNIYAR